jgi:hypothetical protein
MAAVASRKGHIMDMLSLLAASLTLVSTTPDCRIGLASDLIVSPLSTPGHYHPESQVEPGTVTHFFTSGSPQWGFAADGDDSAAGPASGEADLSRLHLRAMYLGCDVAANRAELASLAQTLETLKTSEDWSRLGRAYIAILLYEIYAAIDADGGERERLSEDLEALSRNAYHARYFNAVTSLSDAHEEALTAIANGDYDTYLAALRTMADSHNNFRERRVVEEIGQRRPTGYAQNEHNIGLYPLYIARTRILRVIAARVRMVNFEQAGGMPWHPEEFSVLDELFGSNIPEYITNTFGSLSALTTHARQPSNLSERSSGHTMFSFFLAAFSVSDNPWRMPYEHSPYLWAQYQLALYEVTNAVHDLWYDPEADQPGIHTFIHTDYTCAAEARLDAARNVLDGLFDLEPLAPSRCEPVVGDRALVGVE